MALPDSTAPTASAPGRPGTRLRRSRGLTCYWLDGAFVAHPHPHGTPTALHPAVAEVLTAFDTWTEPSEAAKSLDHLDPETVEEAVDALRTAGLLLAEGSPDAAQDADVAERWGPWAPEAPFFHYGTQDLQYADSGAVPQDEHTAPTEARDDLTRPPLFTSYPDAARLLLPRRTADLRVPYDQVLYDRHTHRDFAPEPVPLITFATLLSTVFGPVDYIDSGNGALFRRTSPAGGARQELDAYVGVLHVEDVAPGVYHYNSREHSLELRTEGFSPDQAALLCAGQDWAGGAAFLVFLAAVIERMGNKYRSPRCYRVCLLNAGHLGQTFALTATALGLGPAQTGAFADTPVTEVCGLDGIGTIPLYVLAAGLPHPDPQQAPPPALLNTFRRTPLN